MVEMNSWDKEEASGKVEDSESLAEVSCHALPPSTAPGRFPKLPGNHPIQLPGDRDYFHFVGKTNKQ